MAITDLTELPNWFLAICAGGVCGVVGFLVHAEFALKQPWAWRFLITVLYFVLLACCMTLFFARGVDLLKRPSIATTFASAAFIVFITIWGTYRFLSVHDHN